MTYKEPLTTTTQPGLITLAGDLGGVATSPTVVSITGASGVVNVAATGNIITWAAATTAPGLTQTAPGTDVAPADFHVTPQPNYASAVTNTRGGSAVVNLTTLAGSGSAHNGKGTFRVMDPNNGNTNLFEVTSAAFNGNGWSTTYFGSAGSAYISSGGGALQISGTGNNVLQYNAGTILGWNANGIGLGGVGSFAGGVNVISMLNETTLPTSLLSGTGSGLIMYSHNGQLEIDGYGINFHNLSQTPGLYQTTCTTDVVAANLTLQAQAPYASASSHTIPGSVIVNIPLPVSSGTEGGFEVTRNGSFVGAIRTQNSPNTSFASLYLSNNTTPVLTSNGTNNFQIGGAVTVASITLSSTIYAQFTTNGTQFGYNASNNTFGGGTNVLGLNNATTNPTSNPAGGVVLYSELTTGKLRNRGSNGAIITLADAGSGGTVNSQKQTLDGYFGTVTTTASATPTAIMNYTTASTTGGFIYLTAVSRATSTGTGIAISDTSTSQYVCAYSNVSGTVSLNTSGAPVLIAGTNITTKTAMTAPVITASVSGAVITFLVTNQALATTDSQLFAEVVTC